jgi:acetyltransferase-like isoleucine patch superfamily enzyme
MGHTMSKVALTIFWALKPISRLFLSAFFDQKYLRGRYFDLTHGGYLWAFRSIWQRNILRLARPMPFPAALTSFVFNGHNIDFHPDDLNNFQSPGTYFQNPSGKIFLGRGCFIGPNVGIITANHSPTDLDTHLTAQDIHIGEKCWIGMNSVILPGVTLGPNTIVGAGSVVNRSFPDGHCLIAGSPARIIRTLDSYNVEAPGELS